MPSATPATKQDVRDEVRTASREVIEHFNRGQTAQDARTAEQFREVHTKLDAIMEMLATRREVKNLVRELKSQGVALDESKIFVS